MRRYAMLPHIIMILAISRCTAPRDFILGFQENYQTTLELTEGRLYFVNPGSMSASVTVTTPLDSGGLSSSVTMNAQSTVLITVPYRVHCVGSGYENKGIHVQSDQDIVVQANSKSAIGSSAWEVPPIERLGKVHVIMAPVFTYNLTNQGPYQLMIVATEDLTTVTVELYGAADVAVYFDGTRYNRTDVINLYLDKYEIAQIQCLWQNGGDLTGSVLVSNLPVYVTSGAVQSSVGMVGYPSNLVTYIPPAEKNGRDFVFARVVGRSNGDDLLVVGLEDDTRFKINLQVAT